MGHIPSIAGGGIEALKKLNNNQYDIMITDIGMPEMDGWQLAEKVKKNYPRIIKFLQKS